MSVVKINAVTVPAEMGDEFMERFAKRAGAVEDQPGFEEFLLLKPTDDNTQFFVFTRWESEEAFQAWMTSNDFAKAHAHVAEDAAAARSDGNGQGHAEAHGGAEAHGHGGHGHGAGPVAVQAELLAFDVIERVTGQG